MNIYLYLAIGISSLFWFGFLWLTRNIRFMSIGTDDEQQVRAAAQNYKWRWPSDMHRMGTMKTGTKDGMIILLVLFQKLFRNNYGERPLTALYGFSVAISGLLIFFIGNNYWSASTGIWLMVVYMLSVWPWQTALYGGHISVATMFFLASILVLQQIPAGQPIFSILMAAGVFFCYMLFSSGSAIKFIPLFFTALIVSKHYNPAHKNWVVVAIKDFGAINYAFDAIMLASIILIFILLKVFKKNLINFLYNKKGPIARRLNIIQGQELFSHEHYYRHADKKLPRYFKNTIIAYVAIAVIFRFLGWAYILAMMFGFIFMFLVFTLPDIRRNTKNYLKFILSPVRKTRFEKYIEYFAKRGLKVSADFRAPLFQWLPRVVWRIVPIQILMLFGLLSIALLNQTELISITTVLLISISPILWGELTRSVHSLRTFNPAFTGAFLLLGYTYYNVQDPAIYVFLWILTLIMSIQQFWTFFTDVLPSRMGLPNLIAALDKHNIKEIYTYDTIFNDIFAGALNIEKPLAGKYKINFIKKLTDISRGWIVIPPTNSKTLSMECTRESIEENDFIDDTLLKELLNTKKIEQIATAKFKTFGSSKIWNQEADVITYFDLILGEINDYDRYKSYGWLVNAEKLKRIDLR